MATPTNPVRVIDFVQLVRDSFDPAVLAAIDEVEETVNKHHARWQDSFGNPSMIGDESGIRGTAEPLSPNTIVNKMAGGMSEAEASLMLVATGQLANSIQKAGPFAEVDETKLKARVFGRSFTDNPKFPLHEFGEGFSDWTGEAIPTRTTLMPTDAEISEDFEHRALKRILEALT